jgi:hypothetical protein
METGSGLIGAIILLICLFPFVYTYLRRLKSDKTIKNKLQSLAKENADQIVEYELGYNFGLALNPDSKRLYYFQLLNGHEKSVALNLNDFKGCKLNNGAVNKSNLSQNHTYAPLVVSLEFLPKRDMLTNAMVILYDEKSGNAHNGELGLAQRWQDKLNALFKSQ